MSKSGITILTCRVCGVNMEVDGLPEGDRFLVCKYCKTIYDARQARQLAGASAEVVPDTHMKPEVTLPEGCTLERGDDALTLTMSWNNPRAILAFAFGTLLFMGCGLYFYRYDRSILEPFNLVLMLNFLIAAWLGYMTALYAVNRTTVRVTAGSVRVSHGPLPARGSKEVPSGSISQLYVRQVVTQTRNGEAISYNLHMLDRSGDNRVLMKDIDEAEQAQWIEQEIESYLGIKDHRMAREY